MKKEKIEVKKFLKDFFRPTKGKIITFLIAVALLFTLDSILFKGASEISCFIVCPEGTERFRFCNCVDTDNPIEYAKFLASYTFQPRFTLYFAKETKLFKLYFLIELLIWYTLICAVYYFKRKFRDKKK